MDVLIPQTVMIDVKMVLWFIGFIIGSTAALVFGYAKLISMIREGFKQSAVEYQTLSGKVEAMELRNLNADKKTEQIDAAQKLQETRLAIMANDTSHTREAMIRLEKSVSDMALYMRDTLNAQKDKSA